MSKSAATVEWKQVPVIDRQASVNSEGLPIVLVTLCQENLQDFNGLKKRLKKHTHPLLYRW